MVLATSGGATATTVLIFKLIGATCVNARGWNDNDLRSQVNE